MDADLSIQSQEPQVYQEQRLESARGNRSSRKHHSNLKRNGSPVDSKKVTAADDWSYEFTNLPACQRRWDNSIQYSAVQMKASSVAIRRKWNQPDITITETSRVSGNQDLESTRSAEQIFQLSQYLET